MRNLPLWIKTLMLFLVIFITLRLLASGLYWLIVLGIIIGVALVYVSMRGRKRK